MAFGKSARARELLESGSFREAAELFIDSGDLASAARAFVCAKDYYRAATCFEKAMKPLDAARFYMLIRHWQKAADLYAQSGDSMRAGLALEQLRKEQDDWLTLEPGALPEEPQAGAAAEAAAEPDGEVAPAVAPAAAAWPAGEIWQAIRAGDIHGAVECYILGQSGSGWNLLAEAQTPEAHRGLAETLFGARDYAVAAEAFHKAGDMARAAQSLSLAGLNEEAAHYYYNLGQKALAAQHLEKAHAWEQAAAIYLKENLFLDAARCHEKDDDPVKAAALYLKARQPDLALPLLQSIPPAHRSYTACRLLAGKILFQKGQTDLALSFLSPLLQAAPTTEDSLDTFYQAAVLMEGGGATDRAREAYQRIQESRFGYKDVADRLRALQPAAAQATQAAPARPVAPPVAPVAPAATAAPAAPAPAAPPARDEPSSVAMDLAPLRNCSLFNRLGLEELRRLWSVGKSGEVKPGKVLVRAGEVSAGLMIVLAGGVTITPDPSNPTVASGFLGPGDYVGLGSLLNGPPQPNALVAQGSTRILVLSPSALDALVAAEPELGMRLFRSVAEHLVQTLKAEQAKSAAI